MWTIDNLTVSNKFDIFPAHFANGIENETIWIESVSCSHYNISFFGPLGFRTKQTYLFPYQTLSRPKKK
jgi:hypothetical protein